MLIAFILATIVGGNPAATAAPAARPPVIPLRDFFRNPEKAGFALSDDGKWVSYMAPFKNRLNIFVRPADKEAATHRWPFLEGQRYAGLCKGLRRR
jgi:hypothetical protein